MVTRPYCTVPYCGWGERGRGGEKVGGRGRKRKGGRGERKRMGGRREREEENGREEGKRGREWRRERSA